MEPTSFNVGDATVKLESDGLPKCFNGADVFQRRRHGNHRGSGDADAMLQWSRRLSTSETPEEGS